MCSALLAATVKSWSMRGGQLPAQVEANLAALIAERVLEPIREPWRCVAALSWQLSHHRAHPAANVREPRRPGVGTRPRRGVMSGRFNIDLRQRAGSASERQVDNNAPTRFPRYEPVVSVAHNHTGTMSPDPFDLDARFALYPTISVPVSAQSYGLHSSQQGKSPILCQMDWMQARQLRCRRLRASVAEMSSRP